MDELQLGLGLPGGAGNCKSSTMIKQLGFDLNNYCFHHHHCAASCCSSDSTTDCQLINVDEEIKNSSTKRSFDEAFDHDHDHIQLENSTPDHVPQTLLLLVWNNLSDQDDNINGHDLDTTTSSSIISNKNEELGEVESGVITGWPPVKSSRKKLCHQVHHKHRPGAGVYSKSSSMFVKVKMEGVGIARKLDLTLHASYHSLTNTLMPMFGKCQEDVKSYNLTYQDKEGDWLLAGDVPWGSFVETVQRLKLLKNGG